MMDIYEDKHDGYLIPGKIVPDHKCVYITYAGKEHKVTGQHEILLLK